MLLYLHLSFCFRSYEAILHGPPNCWGPISGVFRPAAMAGTAKTSGSPKPLLKANGKKVESGSRPQWCNYQAKPATFHANFWANFNVLSSLWTTSEFSWNFIKQGSKDFFWVVFHNSPSQMKQFLISSTPHFFAPKKKVPRNVSSTIWSFPTYDFLPFLVA